MGATQCHEQGSFPGAEDAGFGCSPVHLFTCDDDLELSPQLTRTAQEIRQWVRGYAPLREEDQRVFWEAAPDSERRHEEHNITAMSALYEKAQAYDRQQAAQRQEGGEQ